MFKYLKDFVELRTKVASVFPFMYVLGIYLYAFSDYQFSLLLAVLFFISMLSLDMATTVLNHMAGIDHETNMSKYDRRLLKQMEELGLSHQFNRRVLYTLAAIGIGSGLIVALLSNLFVVLIGIVCVCVALAYSYGPLPLKNTCLGELASGLTMGFLIPLAFLFSQDSSLFITEFTPQLLTLDVQVIIDWTLILLIPTIVIANIMLANNICDMAKDRDNGRLTLPLYIGKRKSLALWGFLYFITFILIITLILIQLVPELVMYGLVVFLVVIVNSSRFISYPVKAKTFKYAVFNLQLILLSVIVPTFIYLLLFRI